MEMKEYNRFKDEVDELRAQADRAAGALEQQMARLKEDFACESLEAAEQLLEKLEAEAVEAKQKYEEALEAFQEKWGEKLNVS